MKSRLDTLADTQVTLVEKLVQCYERIPYLEDEDRVKLNQELSEHLSAAVSCCGRLIEMDHISLLKSIYRYEQPRTATGRKII